MGSIFLGLKYSVAITFLLGAFFALVLIPRLYSLWKRQRAMTVSMPCADPAEARLRIVATLKRTGQPTQPASNGAFAIEPSKLDNKLGVAPVFVEFPQPQMAVITGQSTVLKPFAEVHRLDLALSPTAVSFGTFMSGQLKRFYFFLGFVFLIMFLAFAFGVPKGSTVQIIDKPNSPEAAPK